MKKLLMKYYAHKLHEKGYSTRKISQFFCLSPQTKASHETIASWLREELSEIIRKLKIQKLEK